MLESAYLKVDRAEQHISDLQTVINKYAEAALIEYGPEGRFAFISMDHRVKEKCALIMGDAIHNLRSALDHVFWELMGIDGGKQGRQTIFPIHAWGIRQNYESHVKGIETPFQDTKDFFVSVGAYPGGPSQLLCVLHALDVGDKHSLLMPVFSITSLRECVVIRPDGTREIWDHLGAPTEADGAVVINPFAGGRFEINNQPKAALDIHFGEVESIKGNAVIPTLDSFGRKVLSILGDMASVVERRT